MGVQQQTGFQKAATRKFFGYRVEGDGAFCLLTSCTNPARCFLYRSPLEREAANARCCAQCDGQQRHRLAEVRAVFERTTQTPRDRIIRFADDD
jgi:hypothetical protein